MTETGHLLRLAGVLAVEDPHTVSPLLSAQDPPVEPTHAYQRLNFTH